MFSIPTIGESLIWGKNKLNNTSDAAELDTQRILLDVLSQTEVSWLLAHPEEELTIKQQKEFVSLIEQRLLGKPLAYILKYQEFYGYRFMVNKNTLVPRPDTEELVNQALEIIQNLSVMKKRKIIVADIGTGSGCIAITLLLKSLHIEKIISTDISEKALLIAKKNAKAFDLKEKIVFLTGDMLIPIKDYKVDLIVSNPPYVPTRELENINSIDTAGLKFEPAIALDGGKDGKVFTQQLLNTKIPAIIEGIGGEIMRNYALKELRI